MASLLASALPTSVIDFWLSAINPLWSTQQALARITHLEHAASDSVTLTLKANRHVQGFLPGQHLNITVEVNGVRRTRSYSPAWLNSNTGEFSITVKRVDAGIVSRWLSQHSCIGQVVEISPAFGDMTLDAAQPKATLMLAAGSGITPFLSLLRGHLASYPAPITLLYWAKHEHELCFVDELNALASTHAQFQVQYLLTQADLPAQRLNEQHLQAHLDQSNDSQIFACGPQGFVQSAAALAKQYDVPAVTEAFYAPEIVFDSNHRVAITLQRSQKTVMVPVGQSILSALEAEGINPAYGCRRGLCNTCSCTKLSGSTQHTQSQDSNHESPTSVRLCVNSASSDLTLDL